MLRGYYTLTSGMLTQERKMDTVGNNMANMSTPGFKKDTMTATTFRDQLVQRVGSTSPAELGQISLILAPDETVTNFQQGSFDQTDRPLDFALAGRGFFQIQRPDGTMVYTRNGSFTLDDEGYLSLPSEGRVMGINGPILLPTDRIHTDGEGRITDERTKAPYGQLQIGDFNDYGALVKVGNGMFQNGDQQNITQAASGARVLEKYLEQSNVEAMDEMSTMMSSQRMLQSSSQILKIYDQILAKATSELGRV